MDVKAGFRVFVSTHPVLTGVAALAAIIWILVDWKAFALLASIVVAVSGVARLGMLAIESWRRRRRERAQIAARADDQHEALLSGDDRWGVFGIRSGDGPIGEQSRVRNSTRRSALMASLAVATGLLAFTVTTTVDARSADRTARPVSSPASRPIPHHSMNPTPALGIPRPVPPSRPTKPSEPVRMGQPAVDGDVTFVVRSVDRSKTIANPSLPFMQTNATGVFLTVQLTVTSNGDRAEEFVASYQRLRIDGAIYAPDPAAAVWTLAFETFVAPGTTAMATVSFDIPTDTPVGGVLELHRSSNSRGADVELLPPQ